MPFFKSRRFCKSSTAKYKALLLGINYASPADDHEQGYRPLQGPVNDAKDVKKALIELFHYKKEDIFLMTDEEANRNTALWPSEANIMKALRDFVRDASPGDAFVFFYAGHSGQQPVTTDPNEDDGLDEFIVTCDYKIILDNTLREYLVEPLPQGARLTAILDSCHSGTLLDLDHYSCHWFLRRRTQSLREIKAVVQYDGPSRRHTDDVWERRLVRSATLLFRTTFSGAVAAALAIVRLRSRATKKKKKVVNEADGAGPGTPDPIIPRPPCGGWYCSYTLLNGPLVISVSSCSDKESTWEDTQNNGQSMTTELIQILRKNPSVKVGELDQQLKRKLSMMAFKRVLEAKRAFKMHSSHMSPETRNNLEVKFTELGVFKLREQTAQIGSMHRLCRDDVLIAKRT